MKTEQYTDVTTKKLKNSEYEITATIPAGIMDTYRAAAITHLGSEVSIQGFRKGHVPTDMLVAHIGEVRIMERASNRALSQVYPKILLAEKIDAIGSPRVEIKKLAKGNPLEFTAITAIMPDIHLGAYKKIAKTIFSKEEIFSVTDTELAETLTHIRRQKAQVEDYEKQKEDGVEKPEAKDFADAKSEDLPELTDEFVQTLGEFKTVSDFTKKVRENILEEKKLHGIEKKRIETVEKIIVDSKIELPSLLIEQETGRIQAQMEADIAQTGTKLEDYLKNVGKTIEELHKEWLPEAEKRAKLQLILNTIAKEEGTNPTSEDVQKEVAHIQEHYPDADAENIRIYVETTKRNEMVFRSFGKMGEEK